MSSVLFIEQPAGVGFSYAVNGSTATDDFIQSQNTSEHIDTHTSVEVIALSYGNISALTDAAMCCGV